MSTEAPVIAIAAEAPTGRVLKEALGLAGQEAILCGPRGPVPEGCRVVLAGLEDLQDTDRLKQAGIAVIALQGRLRLGQVVRQALEALKGAGQAASGTIAFGPFRLDLAHLMLTDTRTDVVRILTEKERDILARLWREKGGVLPRKALLEDVWGYAETLKTHTLETHIYRLRQKIEDDPAQAEWLLTEANGYRLLI